MAELSWKIKRYLTNNGISTNQFSPFLDEANIYLVDEGSGAIIKKWDASKVGIAQPTTSQLDAVNSDAGKDETNRNVRNTRRKGYGAIGDQLDLLYKDILAGKLDTTGEWAKAIKKVKDDNPKS